MKTCLAQGYPFCVGIAIYSSFESPAVAQTGVVPMPSPKDQFLGGHAVDVVGYDDNKKVWIMRNSWGTNWGQKGYFTLPYSYLLDSKLASDLWVITKIEVVPVPIQIKKVEDKAILRGPVAHATKTPTQGK